MEKRCNREFSINFRDIPFCIPDKSLNFATEITIKEEKMAEQTMVNCIKCKHATYKQWFRNPVIAFCAIRNSREVAMSNRICKEYTERMGEPVIEHLDKYE